MGVYETATKLASEIKSSKEYRNFKKCMDELKNDKSSEVLLKEYRMIQMEVRNCSIKNQPIDKNIKKRIGNIQTKIGNNKIVSNYMASEQKLTELMDNINKILAQSIENDYK